MSLGPLTTSFTPPADCVASSALYWVNTASTFYWLHGKPQQSSCFPDAYSPYQNQYYSPGICPVGYTRACESVSTNSQGTVEATRATCCPQGNYICGSTSSSYSYPWGPTLGCMSVYRVNTETRFTTVEGTLNGDETAGDVTSLRAPGTIMAYGIVIENGPATATTDASTTASSSTSGISAIASETGTSMPAAGEAESESDHAGLSAGAAAGIGIGTALGVLALAGLLIWFFFSRRRKRKQEEAVAAAELHAQDSSWSPGTWSSTTWEQTQYPQQPVMQTTWGPLGHPNGPKEMGTDAQLPIEMDSRNLQYR